MATVVGVTLIKRFTYRGDASEEFANQYWLTGSVPSDATAWKALADALITQERTVYDTTVSVVRAYGYDSDADNAASVWSYDYLAHAATVLGSLVVTGGYEQAGDAAVWCRWRTSRLNSKGKPIYLRKYYHGAWSAGQSATTRDTVLAAQVTALQALATKLYDGSFLDARTIRSQKHAETLAGTGASTYLTTHTLKRRGKRPGA